MSKKSRRAPSRAATGGLVAGLCVAAGVGGVVAVARPASASPLVDGCRGPVQRCVSGELTAAAQRDPAGAAGATEAGSGGSGSGPALAPLPTAAPVVRSITDVPDRPIVGVSSAPGGGYHLVGSSGGIYSFDAANYGSLLGNRLNAPVVASAASTAGYWLAGRDGGVFTFGNAGYFGSMGGHPLNGSIVGMAVDPLTGGYWLAGSDGGVFAFNAPYLGSMGGGHLSAPVVAMAADPVTGGYWLVGADGGVFAFNAPFLGSMGAGHINGRVVGIAPTPSGNGYWLAASDGGIFSFGDATFYGSLAGQPLSAPVVGITPTASGRGYWLAGSDGGVFTFGDAVFLGAATAAPPPPPAPAPAAAAAPAGGPGGATGLDVSRYQCGAIPTATYPLSIVQVSGGALNWPPNPCYPSEAAWAGPNIQAYIYMNGLPSPVPPEALAGPGDPGYSFGWGWTQHWVAYSNSVGFHPHTWWLDVEGKSGWTDTATNVQVIRGALDALRSDGLASGIYSSAHQWNVITGGLVVPGAELWVPGAGNISGPGFTAQQFCADPGQRFAGGHVKYVQYGYAGNFPGSYSGPASRYDMDYAC